MKRNYTISKDACSGLWYAHKKGFNYTPVFGSFGSKAFAASYARMMDGFPVKLPKRAADNQ